MFHSVRSMVFCTNGFPQGEKRGVELLFSFTYTNMRLKWRYNPNLFDRPLASVFSSLLISVKPEYIF